LVKARGPTPNSDEAPGWAARSIAAVAASAQRQSDGKLDEKAGGSHCEHDIGTKTNSAEEHDSSNDVSRDQRKPNGSLKGPGNNLIRC